MIYKLCQEERVRGETKTGPTEAWTRVYGPGNPSDIPMLLIH